MDVPTRLHKVTAFSQILTNLLANAGTMEAEIIKSCERRRPAPPASQPLPFETDRNARNHGRARTGA